MRSSYFSGFYDLISVPVDYIAQLTAVVAVADLDRERGALALRAIDEYDERHFNNAKPAINGQGTEETKS